MASENLKWNESDARFEFSADLYVTGNLIVTGTVSEGGATVKKTLDWTGAVTGSTVWDPTGGTKFVLTQILLNATSDCTVTLFDQTDDTTNRIFKAGMAEMQSIVIPFKKPVESAAADNILKITTSASGGTITVYGYEL